jgi:prophage regulatory protein
MKRKLLEVLNSTAPLALAPLALAPQASRAGAAPTPALRIIRKPEVERIIGYSGVQIWRLERKGEFPQRVQLSPMAVGWLESEVLEWIQARIRVRGAGKRLPVQYRGGPTKRRTDEADPPALKFQEG